MPELVIVESDSQNSGDLRSLVRRIKAKYKAAVMAMVTNEAFKQTGRLFRGG